MALPLLVVCGAWLACGASPAPAGSEPTLLEARVADASDRAYEATAIWLLDHARESIVLSLYLVTATDDARHPVTRLLHDVVEGARRGVAVTVYLNTRFRDVEPRTVVQAPWVAWLTEAGVRVVPLARSRLLHDKLLIVDERYVLEGSTNWSVGALKNNWESSTLIDSPALAKVKRFRLRLLEHQGGLALDGSPLRADGGLPEPDAVLLPRALLERAGALTQLVARADERAFDAWLLLVRAAATQGHAEFFVSVEGLGEDLGLPAAWDDTTVRRQVIKVLRKLADRYRLVEAQVTFGGDAWVRLRLPPGEPVEVPMRVLERSAASAELAVVTYLRLLRLHLAAQGVALEALTIRELAARTGLRPDRLQRARHALLATLS